MRRLQFQEPLDSPVHLPPLGLHHVEDKGRRAVPVTVDDPEHGIVAVRDCLDLNLALRQSPFDRGIENREVSAIVADAVVDTPAERRADQRSRRSR
jgi:hypothetical protein